MDNQTQETTGTVGSSTPLSSTPSPAQQGGETNNRMLMGILAYIGILVLIPLLTEKNDTFVRYHTRQGLVLLVIEVVVWVIGSMLWILAPVLMLAHLGLLVLSILGIVNVVNKKEEPLPLVGQFADKFKI